MTLVLYIRRAFSTMKPLLDHNIKRKCLNSTDFLRLTKKSQSYIISNAYREIHINSITNKYNKKISNKKQSDSDDDDDDDDIENHIENERDSKIIKAKVNSLRVDVLIKAGLNIARNKIEAIFYENRIRVNGLKINKKSVQVNEGDEIDVIRRFSENNPSHLIVSRIIVLSVSNRDDDIIVHIRQYKNMLIENYASSHAYKSSSIAHNLQ